jgi:hypothetical protein
MTNKRSSVVGHIWSIAWGNSHTEPPSGPRVLCEIFVPCRHPGAGAGQQPTEFDAFHHIGTGYSLYATALSLPMKRHTPTENAALRRRRLTYRMNQKYPLFAKQFIDEEIARKPDYYIEGVSPADEARNEVLDRERERFERFTAQPNKLFVYGDLTVIGATHSNEVL